MAEKAEAVEREAVYLDDGLYRCDNPNCALGHGPGTPGFFTGGGFVHDPDTKDFVRGKDGEPLLHEGVCPTCEQLGASVTPDNLGIE